MAKGRRLTTSRSERLLGNYDENNNNNNNNSSLSNYRHVSYNIEDVSEYIEEDVWSIIEHVPECTIQETDYESTWTPRAPTEGGRRRDVHVGGLSLAFEDDDTTSSHHRIVHQFGPTNNGNNNNNIIGGSHGRHVAMSAPVSVPDWSKILRVDSSESMFDSYEDDPEDDSGMEPPHEYLARSRKTNAFSVYEGVGRTLKGRDMSRVRDAVWSQTGFAG